MYLAIVELLFIFMITVERFEPRGVHEDELEKRRKSNRNEEHE